jgi:hypothetical protein
MEVLDIRPKKRYCWFPLTLPGQFYPGWSINFIGIFSRKNNNFEASHVTFFNTNYNFGFFLLSMDTRIQLSYLPSKEE